MIEDPAPALITIGETMGLIAPRLPERLEEANDFRIGAGGAESNVAVHAAALGLRSAWVSQIGNDAVGRRIVSEITRRGVDCSWVRRVDDGWTGVYLKDPGAGITYFRSGSAASRMDPRLLDDVPLESARMVHLSGVTPALSQSCAELVRAVVARLQGTGTLISVDVNYRPQLWPNLATASSALRELAQSADLVFVGLDEATALWGLESIDSVRQYLDRPQRLVVKNGAVGATELSETGETFVPSPAVQVVEVVGAGDAFAGGYIFGALTGEDAPSRLSLGHRRASLSMSTTADLEDEPTPSPIPERSNK